MSQSIFTMVVGAAVTAIAARVYGPEILGKFTFSMAFVGLFTSVATLGIEPIVVRHLVERRHREGTILATALVLRAVGGLLVSVLCVTFVALLNQDKTVILLTLIMSLTLAVRASEVYLYWLRSQLELRLASLFRIGSYGGVAAARVVAVLLGAPIEVYAAFYLLDIVVYSVLLFVAFRRVAKHRPRMNISKNYARVLLASSWYLIVTGIATMAYNRIDQVMLGSMLPGHRAAGLYAAAAAIGEMWYFVPAALVTAIQPSLFASSSRKLADERGADMLLIVCSVSLLFGSVVFALAGGALGVLYGAEFVEASASLRVLSLAGVIAMVVLCQNALYVAWGAQKYSALFTTLGALLNVVLNLVWIPTLGIAGAALATLVTQFVVCLVLPACFSATRPVYGVMLRSTNPHLLIGHLKRMSFMIRRRYKGGINA
nr:flippase [Dietzia sp. E1]